MKRCGAVILWVLALVGILASCTGNENEPFSEVAKTSRKKGDVKEVKIGQPVVFSSRDSEGNEKAKFSITFRKACYVLPPSINSLTPFRGKVEYLIIYTLRNLGPRTASFDIEPFDIKTDKGYIYSGSFTDEDGGTWKATGERPTAAGEGGEWGYRFYGIPADATPIEATGQVGVSAFRLKLPNAPISRSEIQVSTYVQEKWIHLIAAYLTDWGEKPLLHIEYKNISAVPIEMNITIGTRDGNGDYSSQWDIKGPIRGGQVEKVVYPIRIGPLRETCNCDVEVAAKPVGYNGLIPGWGWNTGPRVRPEGNIGDNRVPGADPIANVPAPTDNNSATDLSVPTLKQDSPAGCARACGLMVIEYYIPGLSAKTKDAKAAIPDYAHVTKHLVPGISILSQRRVVGSYFQSDRSNWLELLKRETESKHPVIAVIPGAENLPWWKHNYKGGHYVVIRGVAADDSVLCNDPVDAQHYRAKRDEFEKAWGTRSSDAGPWQGVIAKEQPL